MSARETWRDLVRRIADEFDVPCPDDERVDWILWERTAFPLAGPGIVGNQVREFMAGERTRREGVQT